jgi:hypothetical protein
MIDQAVNQQILTAIQELGTDPAWLAKIEQQVNQAVVKRVTSQIAELDLNDPIIRRHIDDNMTLFRQTLLTEFSSTGIQDQATECQLTITDEDTVVENQLVTKNLRVVNVAVIQDLVVRGTVNIDNVSWQQLADGISEKTLEKLTEVWKDQLTQQVAERIGTDGISFESIAVCGNLLVDGATLSSTITDTNIQQTGTLRTLDVEGKSTFNNQTLTVDNKRIGVNTNSPEMALHIVDEEVDLTIGKTATNSAYIGTNLAQSVAIGVNRVAQIEISAEGLTKIKQLQVGANRISHATMVPGWAGTKGDIVFNSDPKDDAVFAWVCLGAHRWKSLRSAA